jgi:hypothetical protein
MKNARESIIIASLAVGLCSITANASAADVMFGGNFCTPTINSQLSVEQTRWGVHNNSNVIATVECPFVMPFRGDLSIAEVDVTVYDRHPNLNVTCTLRGIAIDGELIWSMVQSSQSSGQAAQFLVFQVNRSVLGTLQMTCTIPGATASGVSHVTTYRVISTP